MQATHSDIWSHTPLRANEAWRSPVVLQRRPRRHVQRLNLPQKMKNMSFWQWRPFPSTHKTRRTSLSTLLSSSRRYFAARSRAAALSQASPLGLVLRQQSYFGDDVLLVASWWQSGWQNLSQEAGPQWPRSDSERRLRPSNYACAALTLLRFAAVCQVGTRFGTRAFALATCYRARWEAVNFLRDSKTNLGGDCCFRRCLPRYDFRWASANGVELLPTIFGGRWPAITESKDGGHCGRHDVACLLRWNARFDIQMVRTSQKSNVEAFASTACRKGTNARVAIQAVLGSDCTRWGDVHEIWRGNSSVSRLYH